MRFRRGRYSGRLPRRGSAAQIGFHADLPFPGWDLSHGFCDGYAQRGEAVQDDHADLELGHLTVEAPCHEALAQQFHTMHLGFDAASAVIAAPS